MRRHGNLWPDVCDRGNLERAFNRAAKGKRWQWTVQRAEADRERILDEIQVALQNRTFRTSQYRSKVVYEPKQRTIYILPFVPDRIVQHALMGVLEPLWDAMFDPGAYACRPGRGQHSASARCMQAVRRFPWVMQADVRKFYPSVPHEHLLKVVRQKIKDPTVLWLLEDIVRSFPGEKNLPIGNLTSQWLGALYMNELDKHVRSELRSGDYLRYSDDFLVFCKSKAEARRAQDVCRAFLKDELGLTMAKDRIYPTQHGVDFVGYRHFKGYKLIRKSSVKRMRKRIREARWMLKTGRMPAEAARSVAASIRGWLEWADTYHLRQSIGLSNLEEECHAAL